jgi:hypothetical protein
MAVVSNSFLPSGFWDVTDIAEVAVPQGSIYGCEESHVLMTINSGPGAPFVFAGEMLHKRQRTDGTWTPFTTLSGGMGFTFTPARPWRFDRVAVARVNEELHVCGVTVQPSSASFAVNPGVLAHAVRRYNAGADAAGLELRQWSDWTEVSSFTRNLGRAADVGCAGVQNPATGREELHVVVVTDRGQLLHSIRTGPTSWLPFGDVEALAGARGPFTRVDCAARGNLLHVVAVGQHQRAWYTIRSTTQWRPFEDVQNAAAAPLSVIDPISNIAVGLYNQGLPSNDWHLIIVGLSMNPYYTVRSSQALLWPPTVFGPRQWKPWTNLVDETNYTDGGRFAGAAVSWRPLRP